MKTKKVGFKVLGLAFCLLTVLSAGAQVRIFPPHWFSDLKNDSLELLIYNEKGFTEAPVAEGPRELSSQIAPNPQYAFLLLSLKDFTESSFKIEINGKQQRYRLKAKRTSPLPRLNAGDAIYLVTPDRFANANPNNDALASMNDTMGGRQEPYGRHGGDIEGIIEHLDYIENLGFSALWSSPLLTNDEFKESYHGYAITDHYQIDPRMGDLESYGDLVEASHESGIKVIMDVVYNHVGSQHPLFLNPPDSNFFHFHADFRQTNYRAVTLMDPHAAPSQRVTFSDGWFDRHMPDLNQDNPHLARYLIQNSLWWIFEFGLDAFRIDTYAYPDQKFMTQLGRRIKQEHASFFLFGEIWVHQPEIQAYFAPKNPFSPQESHLDGVTDFQFKYAVHEAVHQPQSWQGGIAKLYYRLAADYMYEQPNQLITFLDNHDEARLFGSLGEDTAKLKVALGLLYTVRGIPCHYYGTEILMKETANHGVIRQDFPGGWPGDSINKFEKSGRNESEQAIFSYVQKLLNWRQSHPDLMRGRFLHYIPDDHRYAYIRSSEKERLLVLVNTHPEEERLFRLNDYSELETEPGQGSSILTDRAVSDTITLAPMSIEFIYWEN